MNKKFFFLDCDIGIPIFRAVFKCDPLTAAVSGAGDVATSVVNALFAKSENKKQREWNEKMYERQLQDSLAQWEREKQYNSPENQKQLYKDADLNPNLMMNNNANIGSASSMHMPSAGSYNPTVPQVSNPMGSIINALLAESQIKKTEAETDSIYNSINLDTAMLNAKLQQMGVDLEHSKNVRDLFRQSMPFELQGKSFDVRGKELNLDILQLTKESEEIMRDINSENLKVLRANNVYVDEMAALNVARARQDFTNAVLAGELSIAQAAAAYAQETAFQASAYLSNKQAEEVAYDTTFKKKNEAIFVGRLAQEFLNNSQLSEKQRREIELLNKEIELATKRNEDYPVDKWFNRLGSIVGIAATGAGIYFGARAFKGRGTTGSVTDRLPYSGGETFTGAPRHNIRGVPPRRSGTRANASRGGFSRSTSSNGITYTY